MDLPKSLLGIWLFPKAKVLKLNEFMKHSHYLKVIFEWKDLGSDYEAHHAQIIHKGTEMTQIVHWLHLTIIAV